MLYYKEIVPAVHLILDPKERKECNIEILFTSGGSWFEGIGDRGKTHLLEHCVASRTEKMDFQQFREFQLKNFIFLNAYTSGQYMNVNAAGHFSDFNTLFDILMEMAFKPAFDNNILKQEKEIVLREINERSGSPAYRLEVWTYQQLFTPESRINHQTLGLIEDVEKASYEDLIRLHQGQIERSHTIIFACGGGFETNDVEQKILDISHNDKFALKKLTSITDVKMPVFNRSINTYLDFKHLNLVHELAHEHTDVCVSIPIEVGVENAPLGRLFTELFLEFNGELYDVLRNKFGLVYSMSGSFNQSIQSLEIELTTDKNKVEEVFKRIKDFFSDFNKVFDISKFEALKSMVFKKIDIVKDTMRAEADFFMNNLLDSGKQIEYGQYAEKLSKIEAGQIQEMFETLNKNLELGRSYTVSKDQGTGSIKGIGEV